MDCGEAIGLRTLLRRCVLLGDGCAAIRVDVTGIPASEECRPRLMLTELAGLVDSQDRVRTEGAALGDVTPVDCASTATLADLLAEVIYPADGGGFMILTWDDAVSYPCDHSCDDDSELETMLRGSFVRLPNEELRLRVSDSTGYAGALDCADGLDADTLLRMAMVRIGPGEYAIRTAVA